MNEEEETPTTTAAAKAAARRVRGAGGVVFDSSGRVLLLRTRTGVWLFPKGHLEPGETPLQAALREIREESGVEARVMDPGATWVTEYLNPRGEWREITWFECHQVGGAPAVTEALFQEAAFLPTAEALRKLTHASDRQLLRRVLAASSAHNERERSA